MLSTHSPAAMSPGPAEPRYVATDPNAGPIITPTFVAADSQPSPFARFLGSTASATYAWITPVVPPPAPWMARERRSIHTEVENANTMYAITDALSPIRSAGLRP